MALIFILAFIYNVERLEINAHEFINIESYVYIVITIAILIIITFPRLTKYGFLGGLAAWASLYILVKLIFYPENVPFIGQGNFYLTIIEMSLYLSALFIAYQLAKNIYDIETTFNNLLFFGDKEKIINLQDADDLIKAELYRGRRFELPLSLLSIEFDSNSVVMVLSKTIEEMQQRILDRYAIVHLTKILKKYVRRSDTVLVDLENQRICLLSLGMDAEGIEQMGEKMREISQDELGVKVCYGTATFPDEASTFEGLLNIALDDSQGREKSNDRDSEI